MLMFNFLRFYTCADTSWRTPRQAVQNGSERPEYAGQNFPNPQAGFQLGRGHNKLLGGELMGKQIRVLQYGVGPIGAGIVRLMLEKPELKIVGAVDVDPAKVGKDLGQVAGAGRDVGVVVAHDLKSLLQSR